MSKPQKQQLQMLWPEHLLDTPPEPVFPLAYELRTFRPGDEEGYRQVMVGAGFASFNPDEVRRWRDRALPDGFFVIVHRPSDQIVTTAMATHNPSSLHPSGGELGWVAGSVEHARKRLGQAVCAAVTARLLRIGYRRIYLRTDDWRLPAIVTYLRLGYLPFLHALDMEGRWQKIYENIGWPFTPDKWPKHLSPEKKGDSAETGQVRPDRDTLDRYPLRHRWQPDRAHRGYALMGDVDAFGDESLYRPSRLGTASATPREIVAGETTSLCLTFTAGPAGLPEGTRVTFVMRGQQPLGQQESDYALDGPDGCVLEPAKRGFGFLAQSGQLEAGESVALSTAPFRWTPLAGRREFKIVIHYSDDRPERRLPEPVTIDLLPGPLDRFEATLPCTKRTGEALSLHITSRDQHDNRVNWSGAVEVRNGDHTHVVHMVAGVADCPLYQVTDSASVRATVHVTPTAEGERVSPSLVGTSNPCVETTGLQLYVGDLHCHDYLSEAEGYSDEVYRWAIEERALDFISVVPQTHGWLDNETWTLVKYMNERYLREGQFVPFLGFEWQHSGYGDKVVHYLSGDQPYLPVDDRRYSDPAKLYAALRATDALVIGHHPGYPVGQWVPGTDFECVESDVERLAELWSMHGSSKGYDPTDRPLVGAASTGGVMVALRKGPRLGFVAGSDTHSGRPGGSAKEPRPYWGGLAAVWAERLTRRAIYRALHARHTYALTGARIVLKMTVNGGLMGSEMPASDHVEICIDAWTPGTIRQVEVLKNARLLKRFHSGRDECHIQLTDRTQGPAFYHCRITQTDGHLAVCSPVWIG
jgi:mycothiol synthase